MNSSRRALIRPLLTGWRVLIFLLVIACASQVEAQQPEKQQALKFWHEKTADGYRFFVSSQDAIPRSIQVSFPSLRNLESSKNLPLHTVVSEKVDVLDVKYRDDGGQSEMNTLFYKRFPMIAGNLSKLICEDGDCD